MDLVGAWLRQLLKAGTAAALVPVAMVAALAVVLVGTGGFGGVKSLSQLVAGPQIAPADLVASADPDLAPVAPAVASESKPKPARAVRRKPVVPRVVRPAPVPVTPPAAPRAPVTPTPKPPAAPPPPASTPTPTPTPTPAPSQQPTLKQATTNIVDGLKETVGGVGTVVGQIIEGTGQALVQLLGPKPPTGP
jgi:outer membrane biosynthesis protein TonB